MQSTMHWFVPAKLLGCALLSACGASAVSGPSSQPVTAADTRSTGAAQPAATAPAAPLICGAAETEEGVMEEILERSGRGLLWLVAPGAEQSAAAGTSERGKDEILKARRLADCLIAHSAGAQVELQSKTVDELKAFVDAKLSPDHPPTLLAAGAAYFASVLVMESRLDAMLDIPLARLFLESAVALAPELSDGLGSLILGAYECYVPKPLGGQPEAGLSRLSAAAEREGELRLAMKVASAELCAFSLQDRALFNRLLDEVEGSPANGAFDLLAKARMRQLRGEQDELFYDLD